MKSKAKEFLSTSLFVLIVLALSLFIIKFVGQRTEVIGSSMNPTLSDGDNLILDKLSYKMHDPERFDVVVFPFRDNSGKNYIKRVIGLPGETVRIDESGNIYINDEILHESYGLEVIKEPKRAAEKITLGSNEYFVLGDNRNNSEDSRYDVVGNVSRDEIIGRAWIRVWPFKDFGVVR